jgi:hypothetical protein
MRALGKFGRRAAPPGSRRRRFALGTTVAAILALLAWAAVGFADSSTGCDFAPNGTTASCLGPLSGSTFAGGDGNLLTSPTTYGTTDWQSLNTAGVVSTGIDRPSGSTDNAFGQGTKEDSPAVTVVQGSIPNNKSDLTRFYEASQNISGQTFLYLAWERANVLGNANMDFEINQQATTGLTGSFTGPITLNRQPGDLLVTYDFTNGGGVPVLGLDRWLVSASNPTVPGFSTNTCLSSSSFPCWGDHVNLNSGDSEGAVNNVDAVTDPLQTPNASLPASTFGETAINLTAAGVFGTGTCETFASTFLKSRASSSFSAEVKDFVAPVPTMISNCGTIRIKKVTVPSGSTQSFGYTPSSNLSSTGFSLTDGGEQDYINLQPGTYTVTENSTSGWKLTDLTCTTGGSGDKTTGIATFTVVAGSDITCTYTNTKLGVIHIVKTTVPAGDSTSFSYTPSSNLASTGFSLTGQTGHNQKDYPGLLPGTYTTTEGSTTGWQLTDLSCTAGGSGDKTTGIATFTVVAGSDITCTYTNTKLSSIHIVKTTVPAGDSTSFSYTPSSNLASTGFSLTGQTGHNQKDYTGLLPGTYTTTEGSTTGWQLTDLSCTTGGSGDKTTGIATFTVTAGSDITCTYTNTKLSSIHIVKTTVPAGDSTSFSYTPSSNLASTGFSLTGQTGHNQKDYTGLLPGTYTTTEGSTTGWQLTDLSCTTGGSGDKTTGIATFTVTAGSDITCTYTNTKLSAIHVVKTTAPAANSQSFSYTTSSNLGSTGFSLTGQAGHNQRDYTGLLPGTYTTTEGSTTGWQLTDLSCTTGGSGDKTTGIATFTVTAGSDITCTYTNTELGAIHIVKNTVPAGSSQSFSYTTSSNLSSAGFSLTGVFGANESDFSGLLPDTYTVTELSQTGWDLTNLSCDDPSGSTSGATATITLPAGATVTCTYTNTQEHGAIKIVKTSSKAAATPLQGAMFSITGPGGYMNGVTTGSDGTVCVGGLVFGDYSITETGAPLGYAIDSSTAVTATVGANTTCAGTPVTKTFTDTPLTDITATATSEVAGGTSSTVTCVDSGNHNVGNSPQTGGTADDSANGLKPGIYTCTINIDP